MELADADDFRMAPNYLLAGIRIAGPLPDSGRRPWRSWLPTVRRPAPDQRTHGRTLGEDDARGAREVPQQLARTLRRLRCAPQRNQRVCLTSHAFRRGECGEGSLNMRSTITWKNGGSPWENSAYLSLLSVYSFSPQLAARRTLSRSQRSITKSSWRTQMCASSKTLLPRAK